MNGITHNMIDKGISQGDLVIEGGINSRIVCKLGAVDENSNVYVSTLMKLSEYLHVPIDELLRQDFEVEIDEPA